MQTITTRQKTTIYTFIVVGKERKTILHSRFYTLLSVSWFGAIHQKRCCCCVVFFFNLSCCCSAVAVAVNEIVYIHTYTAFFSLHLLFNLYTQKRTYTPSNTDSENEIFLWTFSVEYTLDQMVSAQRRVI